MSNADIIRGLYDAFATGDIPTILGAMDPAIEWNEAEGFMYGGVYNNPNAVLENVFMKFAAEWESFSVTPEKFVDGGDDVVAFGKYSGKYLATGKSVKVPFAHAWSFGPDGKIKGFSQYTDTLVIARELGL
jgi:ketosteroid isomerase-like protein